MLHIFAEPGDISGDRLTITGKEYNHIRNVLRMKQGEIISVSDGQDGRDYRFAIDGFTDSQVLCRLVSVAESGAELPVRVVLFQGIPKGDKMEFIVQKATELGVSDVVPVMMARSVVKIDPKDRIRKQERWQKIAREAGKQSGRCVIPEIHAPVSVRETADMIRKLDAVAVPWESSRESGPLAFAKEHPDIRSLGIVIGPEGGIEPGEISFLTSVSCDIITLGPRIMRTETAGLAAVSAFSALYGEME